MTAPALAFCDGSSMVSRMDAPEYISQLLSICQEKKIDLVIPTIDTDLEVLAAHREAFSQIGTGVLVSNPEVIRVCNEKDLTAKLFLRCGLTAPEPYCRWQD